MINAGYNYSLKVNRKSDLGYMLEDEEGNEVLLHFREAKEELEINSHINVFIYYDKQHRLCATTNKPYVTLKKPGFVSVMEVISNTGVFVSNNTTKDILVSLDYLPYDFKLWPEVDDKLLVLLKEKKNTLFAKPLNRYEILELSNENVKYSLNEVVNAYVYRILKDGISLVTTEFKDIYVHKTQMRGTYHMGQNVHVKIIHIKSDNEYNGSLVEQKENQIDPDKELLINYLKAHNNQFKLDAKSSSEEVEAILPLSRKAFKRALGGLYKDGLIYFEDGKTILK